MRIFEIVNALTNSSRRIQLRNKNFASQNSNLLSYSARIISVFRVLFTKNYIHSCPLGGGGCLKCPLSALKRCPSYREFNYSRMTEKRPGPTEGVRLREVSIL